MKLLVIFLLLTGICYAEEFKAEKKCNPEELVEGIEGATGLDLEGKDQIGYVNTAEGRIEIKLKDRELTQIEKDKINEVIKNHNVTQIEKNKKLSKKQKEEMVKQKFNLTDEDFQNLKNALKD